jgi:photosystem II stability/assembly factor-like uncharacterized protein
MPVNPELLKSLEWRLVGPFRGGRCVAVAGHPTEMQTHYMGTTGGGVWKTTDGGTSWENISDGFFKRASVGGIAVSPSDPNVIYVGMGEATIRGNVSHGDGVYRSLDGGETWQHMGLAETRNIGKVRVHPTNPDVVYVATLGHAHGPNPERGVYRSKDGGATWELVLKRDENAGGVDLAIDPHNPRVIYASLWVARRGPHYMVSGGEGSGLFKSTDGGDTWTELTRNDGMPGVKGSPMIGKIGIAVSPAQRGRVWALVEAEEGGVFRSDDGGKKWERVNEDRNLRQRAWYYTHIFAEPNDAETVWVLNVEAWKSTDGGKNFNKVGIPHGDNHDLWIDPKNPMHILEGNDGGATVSYNGGLNWSDLYNQPTAEMYHVITDNQQPYRLYAAQQDNTTITVPSKSNIGAITNNESYAIGGGESGYIAIRPDDPNIVYAGSYLGFITRYDHRTGQARNIQVWPENTIGAGAEEAKYRFQWTAPILLSPHDQDTLYITGNQVFRTRDEGVTWDTLSPDLTRADPETLKSSGGPITKDNTGAEYYATIFAFVESALQPGLFWAGSDDGLLHVSRDGGKSWTEITPPDLKDQWALMSIIEASPHDPAVAYVAATRYKLDDFAPYFYRTADYGQTWTKIVEGIPEDSFSRTIKEDTEVRGLLYCGTETGLFFSPDDGAHWQPLQGNLPVTPIHDIVVHGTDLVAGTHGRSIWVIDDITPLRQLTVDGGPLTEGADPSTVHGLQSTAHLFAPRETIRYVLSGDFGANAPVGTSYLMSGATMLPYQERKDDEGQPDNRWHRAGKNPPHGVLVHYALAEEPAEGTPVTLTFLTEQGEEIKTFRRKGDEEEEKKAKEEGDTDPRIKVKAGANRFLWNMRYPDPEKLKDDQSMAFGGGTDGPIAPPGKYRVRLTVGEATQEQSFEIVRDPRVSTPQEDFDAQFALERRIMAKLGETNKGIMRLRETREELDRWEKRAKDDPALAQIPEAVKAIKEKLQAIEDELIQHRAKSMQDTLNFPVKLNAKLAFLGGVVSSGDGKPTKNSQVVYDDVSARVDRQLEILADILGEDLVAFNSLIGSLRLPAVMIPD